MRTTGMAAAALLAVACGNQAKPVIGIVLDVDGQQGALLAAEDVNRAGGVHGAPLTLRIVQGRSSTLARVALAAAESLASDPAVAAVVGHTNSGASLAAAEVYNARHVVQIAPTSTAPLYSTMGPYSFRMVASDTHQGAYLARVILAQRPVPPLAILYVNDDYGRALQAELSRELAAAHVTPTYVAPYVELPNFGEPDDVARAVGHGAPRLLIWIGRPPELIQLMPELRRFAPGIRVLASDGLSDAGDDLTGLLDGVRYVRFIDPSGPSQAVADLTRRHEQRFGGEFSDQYYLAYDAVRLLAHAMQAVGTDRDAIRDYLATLGRSAPAYEGLAGALTFDANGDPPPSYALVEVKAGRTIALPRRGDQR